VSSSQLSLVLALGLAALVCGTPGFVRDAADAADYQGPVVDAHSHVPNAGAIDAYVAAMKKHNIAKVVLLGVGGVQKDDVAWIAAAVKKYPAFVVPGAPVADPTDAGVGKAAQALDQLKARALGEVHGRQLSRKIDRDPTTFGKLFELAASRGVPVIIHAELTDVYARQLDAALAAHRKTTVVIAHGGEGPPARIDGLLARNPNLFFDLSGMHFQRKPALATETGPLDPAWKAVIEKYPERFLIGIDVWAPRLFEAPTLEALMAWTRRILGELAPDVATRVASRNATALFKLE
jgi:predicted TIM-barrel fold metal-dependent hydrolase